MDTYPRASIVTRSGKKGWYVCVTVPSELRQVFSLDMPPQDFLCLAILACSGARLDEIA